MSVKPKKTGVDKPTWPYTHPKLFPHTGSKKWVKKINGKFFYFGHWDDPAGALREYREHFGEIEPDESQLRPVTIDEGVNLFLDHQNKRWRRAELSKLSFDDYKSTAKRMLEHFGPDRPCNALGPNEFAGFKESRAETCNLITTGNEVQRCRTIFTWLVDHKYILPVDFGPEFIRPGARQVKRHKRTRGAKTFEPGHLRSVLDECGTHLEAMAMLGINCGFGPTDCARLELDRVNGDFLQYPRTKTEEDRVAWLWPETIAAIERSKARRPKPTKEHRGLLFIYHDGGTWDRSANPITKHFGQAVGRAGRKSETFYWLRHTFETIAGNTGDQVATNMVMGHSDNSMAAVYRHAIDNDRIKRVCGQVRNWLYEQ